MSPTPECPSPGILRNLIDGKVSDPDLTELTGHLEQCHDCQAKAQTLYSSDTLVESLRGKPSATELITNRLPTQLIDSLKLIPQTDSSEKVSIDGLSRDRGLSLDDLGLSFLQPAEESDEIGRLGHYRILQVLGRGGMGAVFLAEDPKLSRRVALKVMLPKIASIPIARNRFLREAKSAASLKSDYIVTIYQVDEINSVPFLAMELLQGESLDESLKAGRRFSIAQILRIVRDTARGLADAHEKGLVHRDIKPGNLWLELSADRPDSAAAYPDIAAATAHEVLRVKILDFGLARPEVEDMHITEFGTIVGTPAFMAPEQARADRAVDSRADLFSLGCVLYVLCTGEIPFKADTTVGTLMALALNTPAAPNQRNESVPIELSRLTMQLLEKDPAKRPQSAREIVERLRQIERTVDAATTGANGTLSAMSGKTLLGVSKPISAAAEALPAPSTKSARRMIGRGLKIATAVVIAALAYIAGEVFLWQTPDGKVVRIESNDPSIMLAFGGGELKVTGAYDQPVMLTPGKVDLKISKPQSDGTDFEFETDKLVVRRGDEIVLKIEVLDGEVRVVQDGKGIVDSKSLRSAMLPSLESIADIDRRAAMWVLSVGGQVTIESLASGSSSMNGSPRDVGTLAELPAEAFAVTAVRFFDTKPFDAAGFVHLRDLGNLQSLNVEGNYGNVTDAAFENLRGCTRLSYFGIRGCGITNRAVDVLKDLPALEFVGINGTPGLTDAALVSLQGLPALKKLYLNGASLTDDGLQHLSEFRNLEALGLGGIDGLTDRGLDHVADLKSLTTLDLAATSAGDATMKRLAELPNLTELSISYTQVSDQGLEFLQGATSLKSLFVRDTGITAGAVERFHAAVPDCRIEFGVELRIIGDKPQPLDSMPSQGSSEQFLTLIDALKQANPSFDGALAPTVHDGRILGLSFRTDHVSDISPLRELKDLRSLRMIGNYSPDAGISDLSPLTGLPLTELVLDGNARLSDLSPLRGMPLREFFAQATRISDLSPLTGMPLQKLGLWAWAGSDLSPLKGMPLTELNIGGNGKDMDLIPLVGAPLEFLCINSSHVANITPLKGMPLKTFMCENTLVSDLSPLRDAKLEAFIGGSTRITDFSALRGMSLQWIKYDIVPERDLEMLREFGTLKRINDLRAEDFLRELSGDPQPRPVPSAFTNSLGMEFARIPKGKAWLARKVGESETTANHETDFADDFYLGMYEVTQDEWARIMGSNPSWFTRKAEGADSVKFLPDDVLKRLPVERVSWTDCQTFLKKLNEMDSTPGWVYRLPTEAEWQYACRGGVMDAATDATFEFYAPTPAESLTVGQANTLHELAFNRPCRTGLFPPNKLGLYDMHGNVWEWCHDAAPWRTSPSRFIHGGGWADSASQSRASDMKHPTEPWLYYDLGLRVARVPTR